MTPRLEVAFSPGEFAALRERDLSQTCCVVFDVLRATSSMITALANGAAVIVPVEEIAEAMRLREADPGVILAGERNGVRIESHQTGSVNFDLGNSPREFTAETVRGKTVVMTTTNGTRALRACAHAGKVLVGSFLNLRATGDSILRHRPAEVLVICSGTFEETAYEDVLAAGALCDMVWAGCAGGGIADSALIARKAFLQIEKDLLRALSESRNGKRLLSVPNLQQDVSFCAELNRFPLLAEMERGRISCRGGRDHLANSKSIEG